MSTKNVFVSKEHLRNQINSIQSDIFDARDQIISFFEKDDEEYIELSKSNLEIALGKLNKLKTALKLH